VKKTRAVKPVYASMSSVAASGGYYISMACDTIIAHPSTITGSIGVVLAIPNFSETLDMVGVSVDTVSTSPAASFMNPMMPFTEFEKEKLHKMSEGIYHRFVNKVAESRGMTFEETRALAKGRVWTGEDAYEKGLVDVLGGLGETLEIVKNRLGVPEGKKVYVEFYPKPKDDLEELLKAFGLGNQPDDGFNVKKDLQSVLGVSPEQILARYNSLPEAFREQFIYSIKLSEMSSREKVLMAMPGLPHIQ
jgi:protease-4